MRTALVSLIFALAVGCSGADQAPIVERIEMRLSGWSAMDVEVNSQGEGRYHFNEPYPDGRSGSFSIPPQQFAELVERLKTYRRQAVPMTDKSVQEFIEITCPKGLPRVTDVGAVWVHWVGSASDQHFLADLGCDAERNAARNKELLGIVRSLPVPIEK
jgi:hypothetical protein